MDNAFKTLRSQTEAVRRGIGSKARCSPKSVSPEELALRLEVLEAGFEALIATLDDRVPEFNLRPFMQEYKLALEEKIDGLEKYLSEQFNNKVTLR